MAHLEPTIFLCYQTEFAESSELLRQELTGLLERVNQRSRLPLTLEESHRLTEGATRLNSTLMQKIRKSLIFIADATPILQFEATPPQPIPSPKVCVEVGYALQCKRPEQLLLAQMDRATINGQFPFDLPSQNRLLFRNKTDLHKVLPPALETQLQRFNLL